MALRIAYSPTLVLEESYVALYKIYILKNPFVGEVFYVGQTLQELNTRLSGHIHESGDVNAVKNEYIRKIVQFGSKPIIEAIETIPGTCRIDKALVNEREIYWIKYYKSTGTKLLNIASTHDDAECREYKDYLRSIKAGQGDYRYYYCGKTYGGHEVYDEKRMRADGFKLPDSPPEPVQIVEKIVEKIIYKERPTVETVFIPEMPEQPAWTMGFLLSIPNKDPLEDFIEDEDECNMEGDESDFETEEELDESDYEPDVYDDDEELENDESENENYESKVIYTDRDVPFYLE